MSKTKQYTFIGIIFLGLILISAGVGALIAGASVPGFSFLGSGAFILIASLILLYRVKKRGLE